MTTAPAQGRAEHPVVIKQRLQRNTQLTREIHVLTTELHRRVIDDA
jgi:hypothetical protein